MRKRPQYANGEYYHVYNRGVRKQSIFYDDMDRARFVHILYEFNNARPKSDPRGPTPGVGPLEREPVVSIMAWCLMPNHFHLLLQQRHDGGVSLFMKKLGVSYTAYMNKRHGLVGHAFQGGFRAKSIQKDAYLFHIVRYIHLNPVDLIEPDWEEQGILYEQTVLSFLEKYRWSSYRDWLQLKGFSDVLDTSLSKMYSDVNHKESMRSWLRYRGPTPGVGPLGRVADS